MSKVILVHGLFMPSFIMKYLEINLVKLGYDVESFGYKTLNFEKSVDKLNDFVSQGGRVYFVGHSLGGLLIRSYFEKYNPSFEDSCIVTLGTPHNGSSVANTITSNVSKNAFLKSSKILSKGIARNNLNVDIGLIIGSLNIGVGNILKNKNGDGVVLFEEAVLSGSKDSITLNLNHTGMIYSLKTVVQIDFFIKNRCFNHKL